MNNNSLINSTYKPYRITKIKNSTVLESTSGKFILKKQDKDVFTLFNYLQNRNFFEYPKLIKNFRNEDNLFEFVEEDYLPKEQKLMELASSLASLHNKTVYYKTTSADDYKEVKETIDSNIKYIDNYYNTLFLSFYDEEFLSPSKYLFMRNYYKIKQSINFCNEELENWYSMVNEDTKERVSVVHNNLAMDHYLVNKDRNVFISWDHYKIDTPVMDLMILYQNEYENYDFSAFLEKYFSNFEVLDSEKKLFFILISIPKYFEIGDNEMQNVLNVEKNINYLFSTEKLIGPYYPKEKEE